MLNCYLSGLLTHGWRLAKKDWAVIAIAAFCWISIVVCIDPAGSYPSMPQGPGLTVDEIFNVTQGVYLVEASWQLGWLNLVPGTSQHAYRVENGYNPDHPPLGRIWLGIHHALTWRLAPPRQPDSLFVTACARTGSATAFALTVLLIGSFTTAWSGRMAGALTALSLVLMPRVYGHAHLASLETITNLTWTAAVLGIVHLWSGPTAPSWRTALVAGVLLGLAMLTKIQAVLIPVPVALWTLWRWRANALWPLAVWGMSALIVFLALWPYLWFDPFNHFLEYLGRTTNRATVFVWYLGAKYPDKLVPWHYPFVMFGLTVPIALHLCGLVGLITSFRQQTEGAASDVERNRDLLLLACMLFPLFVFAAPGVAVYDGERLFLICFPIWSIFVGRGWFAGWREISRWTKSNIVASGLCFALGLLAGYPLVTNSPCHLCYYNEVATMMGGADRAGLEIDYWGEGITRSLLERIVEVVPPGSSVAVIPTLHQYQADDYSRQSPILRSHQIKIVENRPDAGAGKWLLVFRRRADLPAHWDQVSPDKTQTTTIAGKELAYFIQRDQ